jgi:hypothetical protein
MGINIIWHASGRLSCYWVIYVAHVHYQLISEPIGLAHEHGMVVVRDHMHGLTNGCVWFFFREYKHGST